MKKLLFLLALAFFAAAAQAQKPLLRRVLFFDRFDSSARYVSKTEFSFAESARVRTTEGFGWNDTTRRFDRNFWARDRTDPQNRLIERSTRGFPRGGQPYSSDQIFVRDDAARTVHVAATYSSHHGGGGFSSHETDSTFDASGRLVRLVSRAKSPTTGAWETFYDYVFAYKNDSEGRLLEILASSQSSNSVYRSTFFYDAAIADTLVAEVFEGGPGLDSLAERGRADFFFDQNRQMRRAVRSKNASNGLFWFDRQSQTFERDGAGRIVRQIDSSEIGASPYIYEQRWARGADGAVAERATRNFELNSLGESTSQARLETYERREDGLLLAQKNFYAPTSPSLDSTDWRFVGRSEFFYDDPFFDPKTAEIDLVVAPNPTSGTAFFRSKAFFGRPVEWKIVDPAGRVWRSGRHDGNFETGDADVSGLPSGVYFLTVWADDPRAKRSARFVVRD